jgi:hypothetical protein
VTVSRARHVAAGRLIVVTVQLTGTKAGGAVTGKDSAGDLLRAVRSISNRAGDRLVVLSGVAKHGLATGSKITITFPSALTNLITADQVTGVTTVDRQSAAAGTRAAFSSGSTGTLSRPGEFVFAVTATFGRTSMGGRLETLAHRYRGRECLGTGIPRPRKHEQLRRHRYSQRALAR